MDAVLMILVVVSLIGTAGALWRYPALAKELQQVKRDHYYHDSRLKRVPEDIREAVQPVRRQLANITSGKPVLPELILSGRLYADVSAEEAQRVIEQNGGYQSEKVLIVDVRTPKEFAAKHISNATLIPFEDIDKRYVAEVPDTREKIVVTVRAASGAGWPATFWDGRVIPIGYNVQDGLQGWRGPIEGEGEVTFIKLERRR